MGFTIKELNSSTWQDFETLFAKHGTPSSCWCIVYQREQSREREMKEGGLTDKEMPDHNRRRKKELVSQGRSHGVLVYAEDQPVGWCAYGRWEEFPRVDRGRYYRKLVLDQPRSLWRITCFVVDKGHRGQGIATVALRAALASIRNRGGGVVEAYPVVSKKGGSQSLWFGTVGMFEREGFERVAPLGTSLLMRKVVRKPGQRRSWANSAIAAG